MNKIYLFIIFFFIIIIQIGLADNNSAVSIWYGPNDLYIAADGAYYAKCIPESSYGDSEKGKTLIYIAKKDKDLLQYTFNWYSPKLCIGWCGIISVVRFGPCYQGIKATTNDLALAFYKGRDLAAKYTIWDFLEDKTNDVQKALDYGIFKDVTGYVRIFRKEGRNRLDNSPATGFEVILYNNKKILFNVRTGKKIPVSKNISTMKKN